MKICFVDCLNFDPVRGEIMPYIPLGLLCVASSLEELGAHIELVTLNSIAQDWPGGITSEFYAEVTRTIADHDPCIVGFSTMCSSYHQTLRIAAEVRKQVPQATIIFGGPQATATCRETLSAFPQVDLIVCGEGDLTTADLINSLQEERPLHQVAGIAYRVNGNVYQTPQRPLVANLDSLPVPAYYLYKGLNSQTVFPLDAGRGCPYSCTYCQTSLFWKRRYRLKSTARLVAEIRYLQAEFDASSFSLTHDMLTANKKMVLSFCQALQEAQLAIKWSCSARIDCVDHDLLRAMAAAGCTGIFYGVETASTRIQQSIRKKLDLSSVEEVVQATHENGMAVTAAFMVGFPDEREEDLNQTLCMIFELLRTRACRIIMSTLSPLNGTTLHQRYKDKLKYDGVFSTCTTGYEDDADRALFQQYPGIFSSYYYIPCNHIEREQLVAIQHFVWFADVFQLTCVAMADKWGPWKLYERWRGWVQADWQHPPRFQTLVQDSLQFLSTVIREGEIDTPYLDELAAFEHCTFQLRMDWIAKADNALPLCETRELSENQLLQAYPMLRAGASVGEFTYDVRELISRVVDKRPLNNIVPMPTFLVMKVKSPIQVDVIRVNRLTASLLQACTGARKAESVIEELLSPLRQNRHGRLQQAYQNCLDGLKQLYESEMIVLPTTPHDLNRTVR